MSDNYRAIINLAKNNDGFVTKKQAVELLGKNYYCNGDFHVGNSLSKMVNSGILERVKRGEFRLLQAPMLKPVIVAENQLSIF